MKPLPRFSIMWVGPHQTVAPDFEGQFYKVADVDPVLLEKDREIERLKQTVHTLLEQQIGLRLLESRQRISELEAEIAKLKALLKRVWNLTGSAEIGSLIHYGLRS